MHSRRYLTDAIATLALASSKIAFISGPRQVGKSALAKSLLLSTQAYFTLESPEFRQAWTASPEGAVAARGPGPLALDEIHKSRRWKRQLLNLSNQLGPSQGIVVASNLRPGLQAGGDSLAGRYLTFRLHPFSVAESPSPISSARLDDLPTSLAPVHSLADLLRLSGYPEPLMGGSEKQAMAWSRARNEALLAEDAPDVRTIDDRAGLGRLADILAQRSGTLISISGLKDEVNAVYPSVRAWLEVLSTICYCFYLKPFTDRVARAILAAPKVYLFDPLRISMDAQPTRLENLTALHLLKMCDYFSDTEGPLLELRFVRDKEQREVNFVVLRHGAPWWLIECGDDDVEPSPSLRYFTEMLQPSQSFRLVTRAGHDRVHSDGPYRAMGYERFFAGLV